MKIRKKEEIKNFKEKYGYEDTDLTITQSSEIISYWLGSWLRALATRKESVKIEQKSDGVIELQDENGRPSSMIYEVQFPFEGIFFGTLPGSFVFTKARIPPGSKYPSSKSREEMEMAFIYAVKRENLIQKALKFYELRFIFYFFIVFLIILYFIK